MSKTFGDFVRDLRPEIDQSLVLPGEKDSILYDAMDYSLTVGGKRLRPALSVATGDMLGLARTVSLRFGIAVEKLHTATLIFDDLPAQDNAQLRRGQPALHIAYGEHVAQLAGISLVAQTFADIAGLAEYVAPERVTSASAYVAEMLGHINLCYGQVLDLEKQAANTRDITKVASKKTSSMFQASMVPVATLAGTDEETTTSIELFAHNLGVAFQAFDDVLDVKSDASSTGKDTGLDAANQTPTFVSILGSVDEAAGIVRDYGQTATEALIAIHDYDTELLCDAATYVVSKLDLVLGGAGEV